MYRGTTPTHTFTLPFDTSLVKTIRIIYSQQGVVVLSKTEADVGMSGSLVQVSLTQEETLSFRCKREVLIQLKILTTTGEALVSDIIKVSVSRCLCEEVLT